MKKLSVSCFLISIACSASLWADPLPGHTPLSSLPKDATLIVKKEIPVIKTSRDGKEHFFFYRVSRNSRFDLNRNVWIRCQNKRTFQAQAHDPVKLKIKSVTFDKPLQIYSMDDKPIYVMHEMDMYFTTDQPELDAGCHVNIDTADLPEPRTVGEAMAYLAEYFDLVNDVDPYAGMEKSIVIDLLMAKITNSLKAEDHLSALKAFARLERMGENLPESYYYYYAETLLKAGNKEKARTYATLYLNKYGKKGKYYSQAVDIMSRV